VGIWAGTIAYKATYTAWALHLHIRGVAMNERGGAKVEVNDNVLARIKQGIFIFTLSIDDSLRRSGSHVAIIFVNGTKTGCLSIP
jgi:hypothetical protein